VVQPDGKILMSGYMSFTNGLGPGIFRVNEDGSLDTTFNSPGFNDYEDVLSKILLQPDGKIIAVGTFTSFNGQTANRIIRLNADGSLDPTFSTGSGFNFDVNAAVLQNDGKVIVGGQFITYNNVTASRLVRLNTDGSIDTTFLQNGFTSDTDVVTGLGIQPDGKILVAGSFSQYNNTQHFKLMRLNADGTPDDSFVIPETGFGRGGIYTFFIQNDGKILIGGDFQDTSGANIMRNLVRLNSNGSVDTNFFTNNFYADGAVRSIDMKPSGKIVVGGKFRTNNFKNDFAILNLDGTIDQTIANGPGGLGDGVYKVKVLPGGEILVGGYFDTYYVNTVGTRVKSFVKVIGTDHYIFQGNVRVDHDNNGCTPDDYKYPNMKFRVVNGTITSYYYGSANGVHQVYLKNGTNTVTPMPEHPEYFNVSPLNTVVTYPAAVQPYIQDFCLTQNDIRADLAVTIIPLTVARPGFEAKYKILYQNNGNTIANGSVALNFSEPILNYIIANPTPNAQASGSLTWNFENLGPMQSGSIVVTLEVNRPTATPPVQAGDVLTYTAQVTSQDTDSTPVDNTFVLNQTVLNSYDPNDKTCLEGSAIAIQRVGDYVHYLIRFENTGNFAAQDITVKDIIDTNKFDINTLQPLDGSHNFETRITNGNLVEFYFKNIMLPYDDATNDGYVAFKIKTLSTLNIGDDFSNTASIYFDYNEPIITNTAVTTIEVLGTSDFEFNRYVTLYPNPAKNTLTIDLGQTAEINSVSIYNIAGQLIQTATANGFKKVMDVSDLTAGNYFIKVETSMGIANSKFIKL
jgi:uncharacterized delta-60 repeat protein/uncharacterized repeat protein (TIGR01451 family)